jgi:hypothetical protein
MRLPTASRSQNASCLVRPSGEIAGEQKRLAHAVKQADDAAGSAGGSRAGSGLAGSSPPTSAGCAQLAASGHDRAGKYFGSNCAVGGIAAAFT